VDAGHGAAGRRPALRRPLTLCVIGKAYSSAWRWPMTATCLPLLGHLRQAKCQGFLARNLDCLIYETLCNIYIAVDISTN